MAYLQLLKHNASILWEGARLPIRWTLYAMGILSILEHWDYMGIHVLLTFGVLTIFLFIATTIEFNVKKRCDDL